MHLAFVARPRFIKSVSDSRRSVRRKLSLESVRPVSGQSATVSIRNVSELGILLQTSDKLTVGEQIEIDLPRAGVKSVEVVWTADNMAGRKFTQAPIPAEISASLLCASFARDLPIESVKGWTPRTKTLAIVGLALLPWGAVASLAELLGAVG